MIEIGLGHYLSLGAIIFFLGVIGIFLNRKNVIVILMSIEFVEAVEQEKAWADYLFKDGSIIGLNAELLKQYVEYIAAKRMHAVGQEKIYNSGTNPLPWTQQWITGSSVQVAPQETEISSYVIGGTKQDVDGDTFKGFSL